MFTKKKIEPEPAPYVVPDCWQRKFCYGQPATVRIAHTFDGRDYAIGDAFPYLAIGLDYDATWRLWSSFLIDTALPARASS